MEKGNLRVALCISGQTRTWRKCYKTWFDSVDHLGNVDVFYHFWDYNTLPNQAVGILKTKLPELPVPKEELFEIYNTFKPKKYVIEPLRKYSEPNVENPIAWWTRNQFYSMKRAAFLKRCYEVENNFEYDIVCRIRTDLNLNYKLPSETLLPNTVYTCVNSYDTEFNAYRVGDIYFYADSFTYDQMINFYDGLNYIDAKDVVTNNINYPPEIALYYYIKSAGISNHHIYVDAKIVRTDEYIKLKGKLDGYESL